MFGLSVTELLVILAIVLLLFGTRKLRNLGGDLGGAIKGFRKAMSEEDASSKDQNQYIEGEAEQGKDGPQPKPQGEKQPVGDQHKP